MYKIPQQIQEPIDPTCHFVDKTVKTKKANNPKYMDLFTFLSGLLVR